jgi:hypothetical protein
MPAKTASKTTATRYFLPVPKTTLSSIDTASNRKSLMEHSSTEDKESIIQEKDQSTTAHTLWVLKKLLSARYNVWEKKGEFAGDISTRPGPSNHGIPVPSVLLRVGLDPVWVLIPTDLLQRSSGKTVLLVISGQNPIPGVHILRGIWGHFDEKSSFLGFSD